MATRKQDFHARYLTEASFKGSHGSSLRQPKMKDKSQLGIKRLTGGLSLNTPFNRQIMYECCPIGQLSIGA